MHLLTTVLAVFTAFQDPPSTIAWRTDLDAARAEAGTSGRPLLVVFRCEP